MKTKLIALSLAIIGAASVQAAGTAPVSAPESGVLKGLEIGTRIIHVELREDSRGTGTSTRDDNFLGSIDLLDAEQDYAPTRLYLQYFPLENFGLGISYDKVEADAADESGSDGIVGMDGPVVYLVGRLPTDSGFTPFAEIGVGFYHAYFDEDPAWEDDGDYYRFMEVESTEALMLAIGCDYSFTDSLSANVYARMVDGATIDAGHYNTKDLSGPRQTGDFNLDYFGFGIGIKYAFQ